MDLTYQKSRGHWYYTSCKGQSEKSGGIATNIAVHFYDMLQWIFGPVKENTVHIHTHDRAAGYLEFETGRVRWFLSISYDTIPEKIRKSGARTYRSIIIEGEEFGFSGGFTELHTRSYEEVLAGNGFELKEAKPSIEIVQSIRNTNPIWLKGEYHPLAKLPLIRHPFQGSQK